MKKIYLPPNRQKELLALTWNVNGRRKKVSRITLFNALSYNTDSPLARTLRAAALQRGGVIFDGNKDKEEYVPDCYSEIDLDNRMMLFVFKGAVTLRVKDDIAELESADGKEYFNDVTTISQLMLLQRKASELAELQQKDK